VARAPAPPQPAIVVGLHDYGDADRIVRLLTPTLGRVSALAKRARSGGPRWAGALETGNRVEAGLRPGQGSLYTLEQATLVDGHLGLRAELGRLALAAHAAELCGALAREDQPEPKLFGLLETALLVLDAATGPASGAFRAGLELKALAFAGLRPALDRCRVCGQPPGDGPLRFHPAAGGLAHAACAAEGHAVDGLWAAAAHEALHQPLRELLDLPMPLGPREAFAEVAEAHLERALRARALLDALGAAAE
jgi:DNA repair protein RecO (recombination protein O)